MQKAWVDGPATVASLAVLLGLVVLTGALRALLRRSLRPPALRVFAAEALATFQLCSCALELQVLSDLGGAGNPSWTLTLIYLFSLVHGLTMVGAVSNPCEVLEQLALERMPPRLGAVKLLAQAAGSGLSRAWMSWVWSLGLSPAHRRQREHGCRYPIRIALPEAFLVELSCSFIFHSALMHFQDVRLKFRIHLQAALITFLVFAGGNLTGAVFNPALALSLHFQCFRELFYNYFIVYFLGPALGIMLMVLMFVHFLPWLYKMNRVHKTA